MLSLVSVEHGIGSDGYFSWRMTQHVQRSSEHIFERFQVRGIDTWHRSRPLQLAGADGTRLPNMGGINGRGSGWYHRPSVGCITNSCILTDELLMGHSCGTNELRMIY